MTDNTNKHINDTRSIRYRNLFLCLIIVAIWLSLDIISKMQFRDSVVGQTQFVLIPNVLDFTLVHNTGAAWGIFADSTLLLGVFSIIACIVAILYLFVFIPNATLGVCIGLSLVIAGGIGNAIDRFSFQYVIDFIRPLFIDFPVFNVADIGVTCGVIIFVVASIIQMNHDKAFTSLDGKSSDEEHS